MTKSISLRWPYLADVLRFILKPGIYLPAKKATFKDFLILVLAKFIIIFPVISIAGILSGDRFDSMVFDELDDQPFLLLLFVVVLAPVLEELYFRYHQNRKYLSIIMTLLVTVIALISEYYVAGFYFFYLLILLGLKVSKREIPISLMVYTTSTFFALVHLTNYEGVNWLSDFYWVPLLVFSQFLAGLILSFIRIHEGMAKAMLFHGMWNGILSLLIFLPE